MEHEKNYRERPTGESEFHLRIPEGPAPRPQGGFIELRGGGGGHHNYQEFAEHCLDEQGGELSEPAFKAKFTAWSLEDTYGAVLYPEGPAFKAIGRQFMEGDEAITYHIGAAHYTALMLCLHPTLFAPEVSGGLQLASFEVQVSWETDDPFTHKQIPQRPIASTGEVFLWKHSIPSVKISLKITIFPSPDGQNTVYLGGRLGTFQSPSETL